MKYNKIQIRLNRSVSLLSWSKIIDRQVNEYSVTDSFKSRLSVLSGTKKVRIVENLDNPEI